MIYGQVYIHMVYVCAGPSSINTHPLLRHPDGYLLAPQVEKGVLRTEAEDLHASFRRAILELDMRDTLPLLPLNPPVSSFLYPNSCDQPQAAVSLLPQLDFIVPCTRLIYRSIRNIIEGQRAAYHHTAVAALAHVVNGLQVRPPNHLIRDAKIALVFLCSEYPL